MPLSVVFTMLMLLSLAAFWAGRRKSLAAVSGKPAGLHSLPSYYGYYTAIWTGLPALFLLIGWMALEDKVITNLIVADLPQAQQELSEAGRNLYLNDIRNLAEGNITSGDADQTMKDAARQLSALKTNSHNAMFAVVLAFMLAGGAYALWRINSKLRARNRVEMVMRWLLLGCSAIAILTTVGIVLSVLFESIRFFEIVPITDFLFGLHWSPQMSIRADQVGSSGAFGMIPLLVGTLLIAMIAMLIAVPIGLLAAVYLSEYANRHVRTWAKPMLEVLAGIPTVVYGFFAALVVAPMLRGVGVTLGLDVASESALAAGLVMGIMIIPFVSSLSDDVINAVPQSLRDGSYGLGATRSETILRVILPAALPGIVGGVLLAVSRAIGETMIVVMAAGLTANLTVNPLAAVSTITVQIVTLLVGDQEFDSPKTLAAFALGLVLFVITLILNVYALHIVKKYREQYD